MKKTFVITICLGIILFLLAIFILPDFQVEEVKVVLLQYPGIDKPVHFVEHFIVFIAAYFFIRFVPLKFSESIRIAAALIVSLFISLADEVHQIFIAGRSFEYADLLANTLGAMTGLAIVTSKYMKPMITTSILIVLLSSVSYLTYDTYSKVKYYYRGMQYEKNKEYGMAREQYLLALESGNTSAGLYNALAWVDLEFLNKDPLIAYEYAQKAVLKDPDNPDILDTFGWALFRLKRYEEAKTHFQKAFELKPSIYVIHYHLGSAFAELGNMEKAVYHLKKQIEINPNDRFAVHARKALEKL